MNVQGLAISNTVEGEAQLGYLQTTSKPLPRKGLLPLERLPRELNVMTKHRFDGDKCEDRAPGFQISVNTLGVLVFSQVSHATRGIFPHPRDVLERDPQPFRSENSAPATP